MPIAINGSGTITGISAGGLPDDCITTADITAGAVTTAKVPNEAITGAKIAQRAKFPDYANGAARSFGVTYQAAEDGYLCVLVTGSFRNGLQVQVGVTSTPNIAVWYIGDDLNSNSKYAGTIIPIPKNIYYLATSFATDGFETVTMTWFPAIT
jgi:hypothetical protein